MAGSRKSRYNDALFESRHRHEATGPPASVPRHINDGTDRPPNIWTLADYRLVEAAL